MKNKYEKLFDGFLNAVDFSLVKYPDGWGVIDNQGANLGDIEGDRFATATEILDRMDVYIHDSFIADIDECLEEIGERFEWSDQGLGYLIEKAKPLLPDNRWEFDVMDMVINHYEEVNLENCVYKDVDL